MEEIEFQNLMTNLINESIDNDKFVARKGIALLYELHVNENLEISGDPKNPKRGQEAFQTDVALFSKKNDLEVPFIIIEVKKGISSHDIITYSNKAMRHKNVYPFLRYGLVAYHLPNIPNRFFKHNSDIDFFLTVGKYASNHDKLKIVLAELIKNELQIFDNLQTILHNNKKFNFYQMVPKLKEFDQDNTKG